MTAAAAAPARYTLSAELIAILNASPDIQILLAPDQTILFANAAFHAANPDEAGPLIGRKKGAAVCFEFPYNHRAWTRSGAVA